jgi:hypothetical protein
LRNNPVHIRNLGKPAPVVIFIEELQVAVETDFQDTVIGVIGVSFRLVWVEAVICFAGVIFEGSVRSFAITGCPAVEDIAVFETFSGNGNLPAQFIISDVEGVLVLIFLPWIVAKILFLHFLLFALLFL